MSILLIFQSFLIVDIESIIIIIKVFTLGLIQNSKQPYSTLYANSEKVGRLTFYPDVNKHIIILFCTFQM